MNKAFKKSLLSLTAIGALATNAFAGNAAYLDIKMKYLNSDANKIVLGYDSEEDDVNKKDQVEILVNILDADGNLADKTKDGKILDNITLNRGSVEIKNETDSNETNLLVYASDDTKLSRSIEDHRKERKNIQRYTLDYTNFTNDKLVDTLTVKAGGLEKKVKIDLVTTDAKGLVLRVSKINKIDTEKYINEELSKIELVDDKNLSIQSNTTPTATAGDSVALNVYASTKEPTSVNSTTKGRFTFAPNLEGKTIVVVALGDYNLSGTANTRLGSVELTMKKGIATGSITINQGLPAGTNAADVTVDGVKLGANYDSNDNQGLPVTFIAYVKDDMEIATKNGLRANDKDGTFNADAMNADTDYLVMASKASKTVKVGTVNVSKFDVADLWSNTNTNIYVVDDRADSNKNVTLTIVDELGNPAIISGNIAAQYARFGDDTNQTFIPSKFFTVKSNKGNNTALININSSDIEIGTGAIGANNATNGSIFDASTLTDGVAFTTRINVAAKRDTSKDVVAKQLHISYSDGSLSGSDPVLLNVRTAKAITNKVSGASILKKALSINLDANVKDGNGAITDGLAPTKNKDDLNKDNAAVNPEFRAKLKVKKPSGVGDNNVTFELSIYNFEDGEYNEKPYDKVVLISKGLNKNGVAATETNGSTDDKDKKFTLTTNNVDATKYDILIRTATKTYATLTIDLNGGGNYKFGNATDPIEANWSKYYSNSVTIDFRSQAANGMGDNGVADYYITPSVAGKDEPSDRSDYFAGTVVDFKFSGEVRKGDKVVIESTNTSATFKARIAPANKDFTKSSDYTTKVKATLDADRVVSVKLLDLDTVGKKGVYTFKVTVNGLETQVLPQKDNDKTKEVYELNALHLAGTGINIKEEEAKKTAGKLRLQFKNTVTGTTGDNSGKDKDNFAELSTEVVAQIKARDDTTSPMTIDKKVKAGVTYQFFMDENITVIEDIYGNIVLDGAKDKGVLFDQEVVCSSGLECDVSRITDSYIKFLPSAIGTKQTITFKVKDKPEVTNSITFTNIVKGGQNTKLNLTRANGHKSFNTVSSEVIVKIDGDGGLEQEDTVVSVKSSNKDAQVELFVVGDGAFTDNLNGAGEYETAIPARGKYIIITTNKPGVVTVSAKATIKKDNSWTNEEISLSGSTTINFVAVDLDAPVVSKTDVKVLGGTTIEATIIDANLDIEKTTVEIKGINNNSKIMAKTTDGKTYKASGLAVGTYQVIIKAIDYAENSQEFEFVRKVTKGVTPAIELANTLKGQTYSIIGQFVAHKFGTDPKLNWAFVSKETGKVSKFTGASKDSKMPFGLTAVDVKVNTADTKWYLAKMSNVSGTFGYAVVTADMKIVKKIDSVNSDGSLNYVQADSSLTSSVSKDGKSVSFK